MALTEYAAGTAFPGVIGRTTEESTPAWPRPLRAAAGAPNVLFIVLDDTGFGQLGCYGSPISTPNFDCLAAGGLLYTNMHTTALCSPSRSCIITGRNHHANATAAINELATGYPGYNGSMPFENGFLSEMLLAHGYSTYMIGKYHLLPSEFESAAGPFDRWPLGRGFERFYGFLGGDTSQWYPGPGLRQPPGRAAAHPGAGLSPDRGPGRQGDRVHRRRQAGRAEQAVLPALLHRCDARPAPRAEGVGRPVLRPVRRRLGRLPGAGVRPAEGTRHHARRRRAVPARPGRAGLGVAVPGRPPPGRADDGGLRRVPVAHRPPHRPGARLPARRPASSTTR